jgi:aspartate beta-hydroxylase
MHTLDTDFTEAADALRSGDHARARSALNRVLAQDPSNTRAWLALAQVGAAAGDQQAMRQAVDRLLAIEPRNVPGLLLKADHLHATGDTRSAGSFYLAALKAAPPPDRLGPALAAHLKRARERCDQYAAQYGTYILEQLSVRGFGAESSPRFAQSIDIVLGRKQIYLQQPRYYYFPGLPQIQFYQRDQFPWIEAIEQATPAIREELLAVMQEPAAFAPYVQGYTNRPHKQEAGMRDNPDWSAFYLWKDGCVVEENAQRCPRTMQALADLPLAKVKNRSPSVLFSLLRAGAHIPAHNGLVNTRLICHLPLIVPERCSFRVGNEVREWREGEAWLFDDSIEHEAWNRSDNTRVILLFDVWRPELSEEERDLVAALFEAIDAHGGRPADWSI